MEFILTFKFFRGRAIAFLLSTLVSILTNNSIAQTYNADYIRQYDLAAGVIYFKTNPINGSNEMKDEVFNFTNSEYRLRENITIGENDKHYLFELYYKGVIVEDYMLAVHVVRDSISGTGRLFNENSEWDMSVSPSITDSTAVVNGIDDMQSELYFWNDSTLELTLKESTNNRDTSYYPKGNLCIYRDTLCFKFRVYSAQPLVTADYYVDANTGNVVEARKISTDACCNQSRSDANNKFQRKSSERHKTPKSFRKMPSLFRGATIKGTACMGNVSRSHVISNSKSCLSCAWSGCHTGTADLFFYGTQSLEFEQFTQSNACAQKTKDFCNPALLYIKNAVNGSAVDCSNATTNLNWGTNSQECTSALWCTKRAYQYFSSFHGRLSYDNLNGPLVVHVEIGTTDMVGKSRWQGGGNIRIGTAGTFFSHMYTIDIITHELAHGVIQATAKIPDVAEQGAIVEGMAEIFANHADFYIKQNFSTGQAANYIVSDEAHNSGLYNMANPELKLKPANYKGFFWSDPSQSLPFSGLNDSGFVHHNSSVLPFWYYLLSEGSGTYTSNDFSASCCVKPIGRDKVVKLLYYAMTNGYYDSQLNFGNLRDKTYQAARDFFGWWSPELAEIEAAFHAIGLGYMGYNGSVHYGTLAESPQYNMPFVLVSDKTETGTKSYNFNNFIRHHNYVVSSGANVEVTSNTEINISPLPWDLNKEINIVNGSNYNAYITPACSTNGASGARGMNPSGQTSDDVPAMPPKASAQTEPQINAIPNPFDNSLSVKCDSLTYNKLISLRVIDLIGNILYEKSYPESETEINLRDYAAGMYFLNVNISGRIHTRRIIKN
jgi:Zn-dependent metalloprotease